ncbi:hypothetical protein FACS189451_02290 [Bacteroidia bacterium]|nr:hypothetical protein FACS189451_02290 [Bacteroidia bacterium]
MIMELTPILVVGFLVLGTYKIIELFVKRKERLAIIEKLTSLTNFESAEPIRLPNILYEKQESGSWPLRISLLLIGIGLGCLCTFFTQMYYGWDTIRPFQRDIMFTAYITLFGGIGLFIAFLIELHQKNKLSNRDNQ